MSSKKYIKTAFYALTVIVFGFTAAFLAVNTIEIFTSEVGLLGKNRIIKYQSASLEKSRAVITLGEKEKTKKDSLISLVFVGDVMMGRGIEAIIKKKGEGNYIFPFEFTKKYIGKADIAFANLEGPISNLGEKSGSIYSFRANPDAAEAINNAGFDIVSVANNHAGDWGLEAFKDTLVSLESHNIKYVGGGTNESEAYRLKTFHIKGASIGFLAFSDVGPNWLSAKKTSAGIAIAGVNKVKEIVRQYSDKTDIIIVSFHFGDEYKTKSNQRQKLLARSAIDAGASVVIGHHPHSVQEIEMYNEGLIIYSLGNFVFDQNFSKVTEKGLMLELLIKKNKIVAIVSNKVVFNEYFQPSIEK